MSEMSPEAQALVERAAEALGYRLPVVEAFQFGDSPAVADELSRLALSGQKTATCGWPINPGVHAGSWSVLLDGRGMPQAVIESVEVRVLPFLEVDAQFAWDEGEGERTLDWWRDAHRRFFARQSGAARWDDGESVQCERFRVVWRADAPA